MSPDPALLPALNDAALGRFIEVLSPLQVGLGLAGVIVSATAFTLLSVPALARMVLPPPRETRLADHLPFERLMPDLRSIRCRDGTLVQCLAVEGRDIMFLNTAERDALFQARRHWLDSVGELGVVVRVMLIRERVSGRCGDEFDLPILRELAGVWNRCFQVSFRNRQVIVLSVSGKSRSAASRLAEAVDVTLHVLAPYQPRIMVQPEDFGQGLVETNLMAFWGGLINPISQPAPLTSPGDLSDILVSDSIEFTGEEGLIRFRRGPDELYCAVIGIRRFGDYTDEQLTCDFSSLDGQFTLLHLIEPWSKTVATLKLSQEKRMSVATRFNSIASEQFDAALQIVEGLDETRSVLSNYMLAIFLFGKSPAEISRLDGEVRKICALYGATSVREGAAAQASWFAQFPSYGIWPRCYRFFSSNIACNVTLDRSPQGLPSSDWGDGPLALLKTVGGTAYSFQFHISTEKDAVAHSVCIGPTGTGKTTVMCFLAAMALRHPKLRVYIFDRYQGAYVFTTAVGGQYLNLTTGESAAGGCRLNPFQSPDTPENRAFLRLWLRAISGCEDADSLEEIGLAVQSLYESGLPVERRSLAALYDACFSPNSAIKKHLFKWVDHAYYGKMFNAENDTLDVLSSRVVSFDMTELFKDELLAQASISYIMHRIQNSLSIINAPAIIFIDETEPMLRNPMFRAYFLTMLQEYRKRGVAVVSAFQRPEAIAQSGMGEAIRGQCQTVFFFANPQARPEDYGDWSLTESEWSYIKGTLSASRRLRRSVLLKRATGESVVLDTDLTPLGSLIRIFASGRESVTLASTLQKRHGADWVGPYLRGGA
ncbi:MAG TPA: hypothetical protein HPP80_08440 [Rhodospirillaceae bacterium]|nr:hypothetical protein [Rhodospirillaceae bacterium]